MTTLGRLVRNAGHSMLANLLNRVANTVLFILLSRTLGPTDAGTFSLATSYFLIGSRFAYWGLNHLLTRDVAQQRSRAGLYLANFIALRAALAAAVIGFLAILVHLLPYDQQTRPVILIVILAILPENISDICQSLFMAYERMEYLGLVALTGSITKLALGAALLWQGSDVQTIAVLYTGTAVLMMIVSLFIAFRHFAKPGWLFDWAFCRQQMKLAIPFIFIGVFFILDNQLDIVLLSVLGNQKMVGLYSAAMTVVSALMLLPEGYRTAVFPVMARFWAQSQSAVTDLYARSFKYLLLLALPITVGVTLTAPRIVALIYKPDFAPAGPALSIMIWSLGFFFFSMLNSRLLIVSNRQSMIARALLINVTATLALDALLIPPLGVIGAAICKAVTAALLLIQYSLATRQHLIGFRPWPFLTRPLLATGLMATAVILARPYGLIIQVGAGAIIYCLVLALAGTFPREERMMWLRMFSRQDQVT